MSPSALMDLGPENEGQAHLDSQKLQKGPRLSRNDAKWDSLKDAIHQIYMIENKTLPETMQLIEERHSFKASERKWKMKMKEWKFEKYLSDQDKRIIVAKAEKRARDGKNTVFYHGNAEITTERIENFKRRKVLKEMEVVSPSAETPEYISYHTPKEENNAYVVSDHVQRIIHKVDRLEFSTETEAAYPENPISERPHPILDEAFLNVTNMGIRCSFPTFTRKDILDITIKSDRAAAAMAQAVEADHPNNESVAIAAYIDAIKKITQVEGHSSPAICQLLYGIAGIYPKPPLFDYSISIYRQVVIETAIREGTTQEPRTESVLKIVAMEGLAKSLLRFRQYEEAELKFCEASELFRKAGYQKHSFDCRFWRARTLQEIERDNEALPLLYSVLVYRLEHTSTTSEILDVALALGKAYKNLRENRYGISTWLANFIHVAEISPNQLYDIDKCSCGSIIIDALINLADKLSLMGDFETANSIIRVAIAKTSGWALDHDSKFKQANCNYIYGKILFRQGSYSAAAEYLIVALTILMSIGEDDGPLPARARERLALSAVELGKLVNTDHSQIIDAITAIETLLIERNGQLFQDASTSVVPNVPDLITLGQEDRSQDESEGKLTAAALQRQDGVTLDKWGSSENELEVRTTTTRSYKYGVTFSVSDITGISLSEFFVS